MYRVIQLIKRNRNLILMSAMIYSICCFIGYFFTTIVPITLIPSSQVSQIYPNTISIGDSISVFSIMKNNLTLVIFLVSGTVLLGLPTFFNIIFNGMMFGSVIGDLVNHGLPITTIGLLILPHGILEIFGTWTAAAAGFKIPYELVRYFNNNKNYLLNNEEIKDLFGLIIISVVFIVVAAVIEGTITAYIAKII